MTGLIRALVRRAHRPTPAPAPRVTCWLDQVGNSRPRGFDAIVNRPRHRADGTNLGRQA